MTIAIVGSGPSAVSAAFCLLRKGLSVTMLDVGYRLEPQRQQLVSRLAAATPQEWDGDSLEMLRKATSPDVKGLPKKLVYGSDYAYRAPGELVQIEERGVDLLVSHALGGLSNAWGANVLPFHDLDITDWPVRVADLAPYYRAVFSFVDLSAMEDRLSSRFPLYTDSPRALRPSRQAQQILDDLESHREALTRLGFEYGYSRLAVRSFPKNGDAGCVYCGLCLYGCPYSLIYSSAHSLPEMESFPGFRYVPGHYVERVEQKQGRVTIHARRTDTGSREQINAERVFLGCGAVSTTKIVLESLYEPGREAILHDSQYFLIPMMRLRGTPGVAQESLHTLSQVCLELNDPAVSQRSVHMLIYTYNDLYWRALNKLLGPLFLPMKPVVDQMLSRSDRLAGIPPFGRVARAGHAGREIARFRAGQGDSRSGRQSSNPSHDSPGEAAAAQGSGGPERPGSPLRYSCRSPRQELPRGGKPADARPAEGTGMRCAGPPSRSGPRPRDRCFLLHIGSGDQRDADCDGQCSPHRRSRT